MDILSEYQKIRRLSINIHVFRQNIGKYVYLSPIGNSKYMIEPVEIKHNKFFFKMIGMGLNSHPLTSYPINRVEKIILI